MTKLSRMVQNRSSQLALQQDSTTIEPSGFNTDEMNAMGTPAVGLKNSSSSSRLKKNKSRGMLIKRVFSRSSSNNLFESDLDGGLRPMMGQSSSSNNFLSRSGSYKRANSFMGGHSTSPQPHFSDFRFNDDTTRLMLVNNNNNNNNNYKMEDGNGGGLSRLREETEDERVDGLLFKIDEARGGQNNSQLLEPGLEKSKTKRRLSEIILSSWFFQRRKEDMENDDDEEENQDMTRGGGRIHEAQPEGASSTSSRSTISQMIAKRFSAAKDFRHLNVAAPQSM